MEPEAPPHCHRSRGVVRGELALNPPNCQPTTHRAVSFKRQCLLFVESVDLIFSCYFFLIVVLVSFFLCINFTTIYKFAYSLFCLFLFVCLFVSFILFFLEMVGEYISHLS